MEALWDTGAQQVPMLMTGDPNVAENPIIGFNVIEEVVNRGEKQRHKPNTTHMVSQAFSISITAAKSILKLLKTARSYLNVGTVQVSKQRVQIEAGHVTTIQARVHIGAHFSEQTLLFIPATAEPLAVSEMQLAYGSQQIPNIIRTWEVVATSSQAERSSQWDPPIKLEHLSAEQKQVVQKLLREECNAFAFDEMLAASHRSICISHYMTRHRCKRPTSLCPSHCCRK